VATFADFLVRHRGHVAQVVHGLGRHHHLSSDELRQFALDVDRELERNDYERLRHFDGRSRWETYLSTVVHDAFFRFQSQLWGNWRPTFDAHLLGPTAILMEELVERDGLPLDEAIRVMRRTHRVDMPVHRLQELHRRLQKARAAAAAAAASAHDRAREERRRFIDVSLDEALKLLSPDDRLMMTLHYRDRVPLTRIALMMKDAPRPTQRRIERATDVVRTALLAQGVTADEIDTVLHNAEQAEQEDGWLKKWWQAVVVRPSND
jgi:hypothetical protein